LLKTAPSLKPLSTYTPPLFNLHALRCTVEFEARGHRNVRATHRSTLEVTKDPYLTPRGECIIAVASTKAASELPMEFKELARLNGCRIQLTIEAGGVVDTVAGYGSPALSFTDDRSMVFRRSSYVCPKTVMVRADKAAIDLDRRLIDALRNPSQLVKLRLEALMDG
jgi:hypothetical protein